MFGLEDQYRFLEPLGAGAEGEVYLVQDLRREGRLAALKIVPHQSTEAPAEFRRLARLRHPAIAQVLDAGFIESPERRYFATEYFAGDAVTNLPAPLDLERVVSVFGEACEAIRYLNQQGLRHGDLKPAHILVDPEDYRVQIIDLGYACRLDDSQAQAAGTAPYAAPELWESPVKDARNSDVYALAMIWLELLAGRLPHSGDSESWRLWHKAGDRDKAIDTIAVEVPAELRQLLRECLSVDPTDRPHDAEALLARLPGRRRPRVASPPLMGRDSVLEELRRWALEPTSEDPELVLIAGAAGVGKSRLLRSLARTAQAAGARVEHRVAVPGLTRVASRALGGRASHRLLVLDDASLAIDGEPLHRWWRRFRSELTDPPVRAIIALEATDPMAVDLALERLRRASIRAQLRHLEPLDWQGTRELVEELAPGLAGGEDLQRIWLASNGVPARILKLVVDTGTKEAPESPGESRLLSLLSLAPAPVPVPVILSALGWDRARLWNEVARLEDLGLVVDGVHPKLRIHPLSRARDEDAIDRELLAALTEAWGAHIDRDSEDHGDPRTRHWTTLYLRALADDVDMAALRATCEALATTSAWTELSALATLAVNKGADTLALMFASWAHLGRRREIVSWIEKNPASMEEQPAEDAVAIARVLQESLESGRAVALFERAANSVEDPRVRLEWTIEGAQLALSQGQRDTARRLLEELEQDDLLAVESDRRTARGTLRLAELTLQLGRRELSSGLFATALRDARKTGETGTILRALSGQAGIARGSGRLEEAERLLRLGTRFARRTEISGEARDDLHTLETNLGSLLLRTGQSEAALEIYLRLEREMRHSGGARHLPHIGYGLGMAYRNRGEILRSLRFLLRAERDARAVQNAAALSGILRTIGAAYLYHGDPGQAFRFRLEALRLAHRISNPYLISIARAALVGALVRQGRVEVADRLTRLVQEAPECTPLMRAFVGVFTAEAERPGESLAETLARWGHACRDAIRAGDPYYTCRALIGLSRMSARRGDLERARALLARAEQWARRDPAPILSRIPIQLLALRLDIEQQGVNDKTTDRLESLYRTAHTHGLKEEALSCLFLVRETGRLSAESDRIRRSFRRRLTAAGRRALEHRTGLSGLENWLVEAGTARASVRHESARDLAASLKHLARAIGAERIDVLSSDLVRDRPFARWGDPGDEPTHEASIVPWTDAAPIRLVIEGGHAPSEAQLQELTGDLLPAVARTHVQRLEESKRRLQGQLDELRARSLSERERLKTEVLSRRLELDHLGSTQHPISDPGRARQRWVAESPAMDEIEKQLQKWAESDLPVFIHGESGTGKDLLALRIHERSPRKEKRFRIENCPAIHDDLFEVQLFGYVKGAFTGADTDRPGILADLDHGTLVLDHVGELAEDAQARLLRVLEDGSYRPVGGSDLHTVDLRVIATAYRSAQTIIESGALRRDLYYRLQGIEIHVPPLRERREDIPALLSTLLDWHSRRLSLPIPVIEAECLEKLEQHSWPGNVRELENLILRWLLLKVRRITAADLDLRVAAREVLPEAADGPASAIDPSLGWRESVASFQKQFLSVCLETHGWNRSKTAEKLGLSRRQLHNLIEKLEIRPLAES